MINIKTNNKDINLKLIKNIFSSYVYLSYLMVLINKLPLV